MNNLFIAYKQSKPCVPIPSVALLHILCYRVLWIQPSLLRELYGLTRALLATCPLFTSLHVRGLVCVAIAGNSELCGESGDIVKVSICRFLQPLKT